MLKRLRRRKEGYSGEEWMSLRDRFTIPDYYRTDPEGGGGEVAILEERCDGCGLCVRICPADTLVLKPRSKPIRKGKRRITQVMAMADEPECVACGDCAGICPNEACHVSKPVKFEYSMFKTINKGPVSLPRLFNDAKD